MPKPTILTPEVLTPTAAGPLSATAPRRLVEKAPATKPQSMMPLQVRLPREQVRAIKIAAAEHEQTISDFMLACFHAYMEAGKAARAAQ